MSAPSRTPVLLRVGLTGLALAATTPLAAQTPLTEHTLALEEGAPRPAAQVDELAWLAGRWTGEGLGARAEEIWLPPAGGAMVGVFRLVRDGRLELYELVTLEADGPSLTMRLKHFSPELVGWEEPDETVGFPLLRREGDTYWFDGLTLRRVDADTIRIWVALDSRDGPMHEELFEYHRVGR